MKQLLITIAAVVLVGCGESQPPEPPKARTPSISIHEAVIGGKIEIVKQHLDADTNLDVKGGFADGTPLIYAAAQGHKEIAELLIAKGVNVNAIDNGGNTSLDKANAHKHKKTAELLRKHGAKTSKELKAEAEKPELPTAKAPDISIYIATSTGNIEAVKQHLAAGTDVNEEVLGEVVPLHTAARYGHKEIAELLIAKGADVNAKNNVGQTPLNLAIDEKHPQIADLLRKHGGKTGDELKAEGK